MRIILTHEQADFDALASLLAGSLIDEGALPVLPHRMNRNVRAFVTIYGAELPFVEQRDLPSEPVEAVCIVDAQSMVTVRGINSATRVHVVDHHPRREGLPADWQVTCDEIGATTTLLVERLQEWDGHLSVVQATLLLLGIYEDTGSLTYSRTTVRDLRAAAYLLECGASLRIAADFLNHPLSQEQQRLYDELRAAVETYRIHGHQIIIAQGDARGMDEELSSVVHKLRDLLDPDALFVLVATRNGVQLIARSTSDFVDVAEIAAYFGGGGHDRAAASLIRDRSIQEIAAELVRILPERIRPAVTVASIMSRGAQLLAPETPVLEAAQRMQRFGYEGYPVVKDGVVVGLLTRRAVDRALAHKLNLTAASLMDAGNVYIYPEDSIEHLQRVMADTGWGQVPVVDSQSGEVIGIVTRTDLLKTLTSGSLATQRHNLADKLNKALPPSRLALLKAVAQTAFDRRLAVYIVGGFVRDLLLEKPSLDFDLVVEGDAISLAQELVKQYGGRLTTHVQFGTAKWYLSPRLTIQDGKLALLENQPAGARQDDFPQFLDLITARTEFYNYPTALPTVESGSIKLDLHRRDFTINTLALRLDGHHYGELLDFWGGLSDLRQGLVRVLHSLSFVDDPTRMLRAVRFEQRFGFQIEQRTLDLMQEALALMSRVSGDRIRHELDHILEEPNFINMLARLNELGLLRSIHPGLQWDEWLRERLSGLPTQPPHPSWGLGEPGVRQYASWQQQRKMLVYILWLLRLPLHQAKAAALRLKHPQRLVNDILAAATLWQDLHSLSSAKPSQVVRRLEELPLLAVYAVWLAAPEAPLARQLENYLTRWRKVTPTITGDFLKSRGVPQGPVYKEILGTLRAAWLDGEIKTEVEEIAFLERLLEGARG